MVAPSSTSPPPCYLTDLFFIWTWCHIAPSIKTPLSLFSQSFYTPPSPFLWHRTVALPGSLSLTQGRNMWQNKAEMYQKMEKNSEFALHCLELPSPPPLYLYLKDYAIFWQPPGATLLGVSALLVGKSSLWFMVASSTWSLDSSEASDLFASILLN